MSKSTAGLQRDIGQILWLGFAGTELTSDVSRALCFGSDPDSAPAMAGAVVCFKRNLRLDKREVADGRAHEVADLPALSELNRALHQLALQVGERTPLWIAIDQEGGRVQRVREPATVWPPMMSLAHCQENASQLAEKVGEAMGRELAALGFDIDFAPVLDVHSNPANPIIGDRAFGSDPQEAASRALAFARGLDAAGMLGCGKHFPGHGDTATDSHLVLPRLDHDMERLREVELEPFRQAIAADIPMIMSAHIVFSSLDNEVPATLSRRVMNDLLRDQLGFRGIAVSDDFGMQAIAGGYGTGEAVVQAIRAGCDALLLCNKWTQQTEAYEALIRAAESDSELRGRIAESAQRIREAKKRQAERRAALPAPSLEVCGSQAHRQLAVELAATAKSA